MKTHFALPLLAFALLPLTLSSAEGEAPKPVALTAKNFDELTAQGVVLIDFWAEWCGPCKLIAPTIDILAKEYEGKAVIAKVDVDSEPELAKKHGIRAIPNLKFLKDGEVVDEIVGVADQKEIEKRLKKLLR